MGGDRRGEDDRVDVVVGQDGLEVRSPAAPGYWRPIRSRRSVVRVAQRVRARRRRGSRGCERGSVPSSRARRARRWTVIRANCRRRRRRTRLLFVGQLREDRQRQDLRRRALRVGQARPARSPAWIGRLPVERDRVVDAGADARALQMVEEAVPSSRTGSRTGGRRVGCRRSSTGDDDVRRSRAARCSRPRAAGGPRSSPRGAAAWRARIAAWRASIRSPKPISSCSYFVVRPWSRSIRTRSRSSRCRCR